MEFFVKDPVFILRSCVKNRQHSFEQRNESYEKHFNFISIRNYVMRTKKIP